MKRHFLLLTLALCAITSFAKDIKTIIVTTNPQMHCEACENKIKSNMRFEKGIKAIETNISRQEVTLTYDADKTTPEKLMKGFEKTGYTATVKTGCDKKQTCCEKQQASCGQKQNCCDKAQADCSKQQANCEKKQNCCDKQQTGCKQDCKNCSKTECCKKK